MPTKSLQALQERHSNLSEKIDEYFSRSDESDKDHTAPDGEITAFDHNLESQQEQRDIQQAIRGVLKEQGFSSGEEIVTAFDLTIFDPKKYHHTDTLVKLNDQHYDLGNLLHALFYADDEALKKIILSDLKVSFSEKTGRDFDESLGGDDEIILDVVLNHVTDPTLKAKILKLKKEVFSLPTNE